MVEKKEKTFRHSSIIFQLDLGSIVSLELNGLKMGALKINYVMSLFPLAVSVKKNLDRTRRNFLWGGNKEKRSFHIVTWDKVMLDKRRGGQGIINLKIYNNSLLMKWLWIYGKEQGNLWRRLIFDKTGIQNLGLRALLIHLMAWDYGNTFAAYGLLLLSTQGSKLEMAVG